MNFLSLLSEASTRWREDKVPQLAASTAYYAIFSLAPLLIVIIAVLGLFFDTSSARSVVLDQVSDIMGKEGAEGVGSMIDSARLSTNSGFALFVGIGTLILGATGVMMALQDAANFIWKVTTKKSANSMVIAVLKRIFSLAFILGIGFLLLISLVVSAALAAFSLYLQHFGTLAMLLPSLNLLVSFLVFFILFAVLLKYIPDVIISWKDILPGALLTAALFVLGKSLLGWYLGRQNAVSAYGVAGSLIIVLLWINYSSQIFFFGIEFTKACTLHRKASVTPRKYAEFTEPLTVHRK